MKTILSILLITIGLCLPVHAQDKQALRTEEFYKIQTLVENGSFRIEINRAYPSGGRSIDLFSNQGIITIQDSTAKGFLPFFGRAYSVPYGGSGSIQFDNKIEKKKVTLKEKKKNPRILYQFTVKGDYDTYGIYLDISVNGSCSVSVRSNQKSQISYTGELSALPTKLNEP